MDPTALTLPDDYGLIPLQITAIKAETMNIQQFKTVLEAGLRHFPKKKGICLLFRKDESALTRRPSNMLVSNTALRK